MQAFSQQAPEVPTAFLGNLPKGTVQGDFDELFKGLQLQEVRIVHDRETGEMKGYGYAMFHDQESLQKAVAMDGTVVNGQAIKIDVKRPSNRNRGGPYQNRGGARNEGFSAFGSRQGRFQDQQQQHAGGQGGLEDRRYNRPVPDNPPFVAYVGNLPEEAVESDLETMFNGLDLAKVHLAMDRETNRHKGYGYAEFNKREDLVRALTLNGAAWMNKTLKVNVYERKERSGDRGSGFGGQQHAAPQSNRFPRAEGFGGGDRKERGFGGGDDRKQAPAGNRFRPGDDIPKEIDDKDRPKLVLQKRTEGAPAETTRPAQPSGSKPSPFGSARPVDTATKLRQMEEEKKAAAEAAKKAAEAKAAAEGKADAAAGGANKTEQ